MMNQRSGPALEWYWVMLIVLVGTVSMGFAIRALF
jgi:hypothetical protein